MSTTGPQTFGSVWFPHSKRKSTAVKTIQRAHARLIRLLAGDASRRTPPPISLAGRLADLVPPSIPSPRPPPARRAPVYGHKGKVHRDKSEEDDGANPYTREQLACMNARFVARVEQAFASGLESRAVASATYVTGFPVYRPTDRTRAS